MAASPHSIQTGYLTTVEPCDAQELIAACAADLSVTDASEAKRWEAALSPDHHFPVSKLLLFIVRFMIISFLLIVALTVLLHYMLPTEALRTLWLGSSLWLIFINWLVFTFTYINR